MPQILQTKCEKRREPLLHAFGFKGGALTELWQVTCQITTTEGLKGEGHGVYSVLWSDAAVFARYGQEQGNALMYALTEFALQKLEGMSFTNPPELINHLLPGLMEYGKELTGGEVLRTTFYLNALVPVDLALWQIYAKEQKEKGKDAFLQELAAPFTGQLTEEQQYLGNIPLITYETPEEQILDLAKKGDFLFKIKIGSNPGGRNQVREMLEWDVARLAQIHDLLKDVTTPWTECGHPVYYLDANGRYPGMEEITYFLAEAEKIGALERIVLLEEPFPEEALMDVRDLPVLVAADESAHGAKEVAELIDRYGYGAIALKPIAKTLSVTLQSLEEAGKRGVPCFCADLTVNPTMVEWNKRVASHLKPLPGLKIGVVESNGEQNYLHWEEMKQESPSYGKKWTLQQDGIYQLDEEYRRLDGGIWQ